MKKNMLILFCIFNFCLIGAQNYGDGNGSIISVETFEGCQYVRRKHVQTVKMSEECDVPSDCKSLWKDFLWLRNSDYVLMNEWGEFPLIENCSGKMINIKEIIELEDSNHDLCYPYLYHVEVDGKSGYMRGFDCDFYKDGKWSIVGQIESSGRKWTVRKVEDFGHNFYVKERLYVRDKPGINGTKKIHLFYENEKPPEFYLDGKKITIKNVTDEKEVVDGMQGRWLNIECDGIEGWVFEGYVNRSTWFGYKDPEVLVNLYFTEGQP